MSETPQKSTRRRTTRMLDMDYKPSISVHIVNSPVPSKALTNPAPQSPAFSTRSRVTITERVDTLSHELDVAKLKRSASKGSAKKHPTIVPSGRLIKLDSPASRLKLDKRMQEEMLSQESVLAEPIPQSQDPEQVKSPRRVKHSLTTKSIMKVLEEGDKESEDGRKDGSDDDGKNAEADIDDDSNDTDRPDDPAKDSSEDFHDTEPNVAADSSGDESNDYFSADEVEKHKKDKSVIGKEKPVERQVVEDTTSSEEIPVESKQETPKKKKKRKSASTPESKSKKDSIKNLVDSSLKVISMEINAVVSNKDETTGEKKITNIKITKGSPLKPTSARKKSISPTKPSPLLIQASKISSAKKKEIQLKAMKSWNITDTEGSETNESDSQGKEIKVSPQKVKKSPSKSPEKSVKDEPFSPFKSPKKNLANQQPEESSKKKLKLDFDAQKESESKDFASIEESVDNEPAAEEVDKMEEDDGGLQDEDFEDGEEMEADSKTNGAESDEDSDEAPEEVSMQTSKKAVSKIVQQELEAIHNISQAKKDKQLKREARKKEEIASKKLKLGENARIELLPESVLEHLQDEKVGKEVEGETPKKKKRKKHKKNKHTLVEDQFIKPTNKLTFSDDYIPLKVEGPTKFGVMPLDGTSALNFKGKNKYSAKYKANKSNRLNSKEAQKIKEKMAVSSHSVPAAFMGDKHFF